MQDHTPEIKDRVLEAIANGTTMRRLAAQDGMPGITTIYRWTREDPEFGAKFAEARSIGFDTIAESTMDIADDVKERTEHIQKAKLRIDTRLKLLASWAPKTYGEKKTVDVGNKDGETFKTDNNVDTVALTLELAKALRASEPSA